MSRRAPYLDSAMCVSSEGRPHFSPLHWLVQVLQCQTRARSKTVSEARRDALLTRTRAHGASLGITTEADVERLSDEYHRIRDYVKLAAPEPEVLRIAGEEAKQNGTSQLTSRQIDRVIRATRATRAARKKK